MKIAEETGDADQKEQAKVNFGMANASLKWGSHKDNILQNLDQTREEEEKDEDEEDRLPDINERKN